MTVFELHWASAADPKQPLAIMMVFRISALVVLFVSAISMAAESVGLMERESLPEIQSVALDAVAQAVVAAGYEPQNFRARVSCNTDTCEVDVFPEELETEVYVGFRGCPLKYCATIVFSIQSREIIETTYWR